MRHVIAPACGMAIVAALAAWPATGQIVADWPAAIVAAVEAGQPPVEELEVLAEDRTVTLAPGDRIVLAYVATCVLETVAGPGSVQVLASSSAFGSGAMLVGRAKFECEGRPTAGTSAGQGGALRWRGQGSVPAEDRVRDMLIALRTARGTAALGRALFEPGGVCGAARVGVQGKLCRLLSGLLVRMTPLLDPRALITLNSTSGIYREGEYLVVTATAPSDVEEAHLHVVYLDESGEVVHMLPNRFVRDTLVRGGEQTTIGAEGAGRRKGVRDYRVSPPFGRGTILAMLSPASLPPLGEREVESFGSFLAALETALRKVADPSTVRFASVGLLTLPR